MEENIYYKSMFDISSIELTCEIETRQLGEKKQDHADFGVSNTNENPEYWIAAFDGHGKNHTIDIIRKANLNEIMGKEKPYEILQKLIIDEETSSYTNDDKLRSGSTMVYAKTKITDTHREIEIVNIGDSQGLLWINGVLTFMTTPHNLFNGEEIARIVREKRVNSNCPITVRNTNIEVLSPTTVMIKKGKYARFTYKYDVIEIAPTQSLGHMGFTGISPEVTKFKLKLTDTFKICLYSDGVSDMIPLTGIASYIHIPFMTNADSVKDILDEVESRWKQEWNMCTEQNRLDMELSSFDIDGYDDCVCAMMIGR
jgi:serine/threonine protein phosphatase PrpC